MKKVLARIITQIEEGNLLSAACGQRPDVLPPMFVRLLQVGEETGNIQASLRQIATQMERAAAIGQMWLFVLQNLARLGFSDYQIYTTLEMRMKCGIKKCGRCNVGNVYVCQDGPVFSLAQLKQLPQEY